MHLRETITTTEYRDWLLHYKQTGFAPPGLRAALARNTHATIAAMAGAKAAGRIQDHLDPPMTEVEQALADEQKHNAMLDAVEQEHGI